MNPTKKEALINRPLIDLREMLERENKLLANKKFIEKLKDKGDKVRKLRDEIERVIKIKESVEETESFLARLSLGDKAILPKHPMFSADSKDIKMAKQAMNAGQQKKDAIREILNEEIDIYSIAISRTFDEQLCQKRSERFIPNRIPGKKKETIKKDDDKMETNVKQSTSNQRASEERSQTSHKSIESDKIENKSNDKKSSDNQVNERRASTSIFEKYKDTALEPYDRESKFVSLSIESSLEFGKDQKVKDFQVEKLKLENRLEWRKITEFDSDESETSDTDSDNEMDD